MKNQKDPIMIKIKLLENKSPTTTLLIEELFENLEQEQALTWLMEALSYFQNQTDKQRHCHLYHTSLFELYVDFNGGKVHIAAILACHPKDEVMSVEAFLTLLKEAATKEVLPHHFYSTLYGCEFIHSMNKKRNSRRAGLF